MIQEKLLDIDVKIDECNDILTLNIFDSSDMWYKIAAAMQSIVIPIALTIITICFLIEFLKITIQMDILKWEYGLKCVSKLIFAKVCIDVSTYFLDATYSTAASWTSSALNTSITDKKGTVVQDVGSYIWGLIADTVADAGTFELLGIFITTGIFFLAISVAVTITEVMAYARAFEICVLLSMAPLPCAFLPLEDGGMSRILRKYFFSFASVCLSGLFMIISIKLYTFLVSSLVLQTVTAAGDEKKVSIGSLAGTLFMASIVLVIAVVKSGSWAQKIFDVG